MSYFDLNDDRTRIAAIAGAAVLVVGGLYAYNKYYSDQDWSEKQRAAKSKLADAREAVKQTAHKAANKVTGHEDKTATAAAKTSVSLQPKTATVNTKTTSTPVASSVSTNSAGVTTASATTSRTTSTTLNQPAKILVETEPQLKKVTEIAPAVQEVVHPIEMEEVQPVIHREVRKVEVHQVTQPIYEEYTAPLKEINREMVAEHKPTIIADNSIYKRELERGAELSSQQYSDTKKTVVYKPAIVEEVIKTDIIEVIQPVIHRDTVEPTVIHTTQPIYEQVREQPYIVKETRKPIVLTHEEAERLKNSTPAGQINLLEKHANAQATGGVVDHKYDDKLKIATAVVTPAVQETITTTTTTTVEDKVIPAGSIQENITVSSVTPK